MFRRVGRKRDVEDAAAEGQRQAAPSEPVGRKTSATLGAFQAGVDAHVRRRSVGDRDGDRRRSRQSDAVTSAAMHLQRKRSVLGADERAEQESNAAAGQGVSRICRNESATDPVERGSAPTERVRRRGAASRVRTASSQRWSRRRRAMPAAPAPRRPRGRWAAAWRRASGR